MRLIDSRESYVGSNGSSVRWGVVAAGVLVAFLSYMLFVTLGAGIGGLTAAHLFSKNRAAPSLMTGAGVWLGASAILAQFCGSYFAVRFSDIRHRQLAACQAVVISAVFFALVVNGIGGTLVGSFASVAGSLSALALTDIDAAVIAQAASDAGWLLFVTLICGVGSALIGAVEGTIGNVRRPFQTRDADEKVRKVA